MYTASDAREYSRGWVDAVIIEQVRKASCQRKRKGQINVHYDDGSDVPMEDRIVQWEHELTQRGFKVEVVGRDSFRFAEVHFSW